MAYGSSYGNTNEYGRLKYNNTNEYGRLKYKGDLTKVLSLDLLIQQYKKSYINSATTQMVQQIVSPPKISLITVGEISGLNLIQQFKKGYING